MELNEKLKEAGLTGNESKVYLELVKKGKLSANMVSKNLSIDRTLSYGILNRLVEKGVCSYIIQQNKKFFSVLEPENFLNNLRRKEIVINELISDIRKIRKVDDKGYEVNVYEGKEAVRNMYSLFRKHKEMLSFGATGRAYDYLYESPALADDLVKRGMFGKIITSKKYKFHPMTAMKNIEIRYADYNSNATTTIFGDYVMIHMVKEKPIVMLIKSRDVSASYRKHFEILWASAGK